ncbi:hypothetical protein BD309DRAFT_329238 [Dichomitus squalens]|nr:hypothetical protein BD309DRAFT_329238 [Dichomitus squalens]
MDNTSTFRITPAIGVTYHLGSTDEDEDSKEILPEHAAHDEGKNEKAHDPQAARAEEEEEEEEVMPYPTPMSVAEGKRRAAEVEEADDAARQSDQLRGKKARVDVRAPNYIYISSDSEDDVKDISKPSSKPGRPSKPAESKQEEAHKSSASPGLERGSVERLQPDTPKWLATQLTQIQRLNPSAKLELLYHYSVDGDVWTIKCLTCSTRKESKVICVGPTEHLNYLRRHLNGRPHLLALGIVPPSKDAAQRPQARPPRQLRKPSPRLPAGRSHAAAAPAMAQMRQNARVRDVQDDAVERFLDQIGLPVRLAEKLHAFGIMNEERLNMAARWKDEGLKVLMDSLHTEAKIDYMSCVAIRNGLKARGNAA